MLMEGIHGFCMALADSVPGVSGGTIAFIMGFYDDFIGSVHDLAFGKLEEKKAALRYLAKLGIGWLVGMSIAAVALSALFESHIYTVSSLFLGFVAASIPLIIREEKTCMKEAGKGMLFLLAGIGIVVGISWANSQSGSAAMDLSRFSPDLALRLFLIGMIAISAMFLPGISGSTLLLIFGAYIPVLTAVRGFLSLDFSYVPCLTCFGCGVLTGAVTVVKVIKTCLERFRVQTIFLILGMMVGSFYAIILGPTTLEIPKAALGPENFELIPMIAGATLVLGMQEIKERGEINECNPC